MNLRCMFSNEKNAFKSHQECFYFLQRSSDIFKMFQFHKVKYSKKKVMAFALF